MVEQLFGTPMYPQASVQEGQEISVATRYGEPAVRTLYRALAIGPLDATTENQALVASLGVTEEVLLGEWGRWVSEQVGV